MRPFQPLKGLWKLSWIEVKVFVREPMGVVGSLVVPVIVFLVLGRVLGARARDLAAIDGPVDPPLKEAPFNLAILAAISFMAIWSFRATLTLIAEADARRNKAEEAASAKPPDKGRGGQIRPRE